jgi:uncharacterized membrane protein
MTDRKLVRLSATLLFIGFWVAFLGAILHPQEPLGPNDHPTAFAVYAAAGNYTAVHLVAFVGEALIIAGLLVLFFALNLSQGSARWVGLFGAISGGVALGIYGVLQAVDGVALKQAVDPWVSAPAADKSIRFVGAETVRWLEWGFRRYHSMMFGLALVLFALAIVWTARVPRVVGYLMGLSGLAYIVSGWLIGTEGFSPRGALPAYAYELLVPVWIIWFFVVAWRMRQTAEASPARPATAAPIKP